MMLLLFFTELFIPPEPPCGVNGPPPLLFFWDLVS